MHKLDFALATISVHFVRIPDWVNVWAQKTMISCSLSARRLSVTRSRGFDQVWERIARERRSPEFVFRRVTRPPAGASDLDRLEYWALSLSDEDYE